MEPPKEEIFNSREELLISVRRHAIRHGYIITIHRSTANRQVILGCDRGGQHRNRLTAPDGTKQRFTTTRRINCPFKLYGKRLPDNRWDLQIRCPTHNHEADDLMGHPQARQLTNDQLQDFSQMVEIGTQPRDILALLREKEPSIPLISRDIYNKRQTIRREKLGGKSPLEYLHNMLVEEQWKFGFKQDSEGRAMFLMFAHRESIDFANRYNRVFVLDCTYKTNRYRMPLLHIVGVSPSNATFSVALCFMHNERTESYVWALQTFFSFLQRSEHLPVLCTDRDLALLNAIEEVCPRNPHLLCIWHINKNVTAKVKGQFATSDEFDEFYGLWMKLVHAPTEDEYNKRLADLDSKCAKYQSAIHYVKGVWLIHKQKFVVAWTRQHLHLGNAATSRVEGSHAFIKKHIGSSSGSMLIVFEQVKRAIQTQIDILKLDVARDRLENPLVTSHPIYSKVTTQITRYAIKLIEQQFQKARSATERSPLPACTNVWTVTMGLPCAHRLTVLLQRSIPIELQEVHSFWHTNARHGSKYLPLLEPRLPNAFFKSRKRQSPFADPGRIEKRDLCSFEVVETRDNKANGEKSQKRAVKCSNCGRIGHTLRTCPVARNA